MAEHDPLPFVTLEPPIEQGGGCFRRVKERFAEPAPDRFFFPQFGYLQWESNYPHLFPKATDG